MSTNLTVLIDKLDNICRVSLEQAAALCLSKSHYNIEIAHWLLTLMENKNSDIALLYLHLEVDISRLQNDLHHILSTLKTGNAHPPALSQRLIDFIREALLISTLDCENAKIRSAYLLLALFSHEEWQRFAQLLSAEFVTLNADKIRSHLPEIFKQSLESPHNTSLPSVSSPLTSQTNALGQFTLNLNDMARQGKIEDAVGRENEICQIINILLRRRQNNPILTGEPGVGKTAIVEGLAWRIVQKNVPKALEAVTIHTLDLGLLQAGAGIRGEFENRLKSLMQEVKCSPHPIILFVDEAHTLIGAGAQSGQTDAANLLKPALARGELRTIAATTWTEYKKYFEKDAALTRRFQVIHIHEPSRDIALSMLRSMVPSLEKHHCVEILEEASQAAIDLSHRYIADRLLPDKAVSVLDTACARVVVRKEEQPLLPESVNADSVAEVIAEWTGVPVGRMRSHEFSQLLNLESCLRSQVIGQEHALHIISQRIKTARTHLTDPSRPTGVFLLAGPSGVGKTQTALALAENLYGSTRSLVTLNLSEFKEAHKVSLLMGSPPGYVGYGEGGILTEAIRRKPYSLVLLDEVEKAHPSVQDIFYQVFDKGILRDGEGRDIDFKNTVIILTSNLGSEFISQQCANSATLPFSEELIELIRPELLRVFKPAFLGRLTIVPYLALDESRLKQIAALQLHHIQQRVKQHYGTELQFSASFIEQLIAQCHAAETGARLMDQWLTDRLLPILSSYFLTQLIEQKMPHCVSVEVNMQGEIMCQ